MSKMGLSEHLQGLLDTITTKQARLESLRPLDLLLVQKIQEKFRIEYNYHSNHIEGNSLTLQETRSLLTTQIIASDKPKKLRDYNEMNGHDKALSYLGLIDKLSYAEQTIKSEEFLISEKLIKEIHQMILIEDYKKQVRDESGNVYYVDVKVGEYKPKENHVQRLSDGTMWQFASVLDTPLRIHDLIQRFDAYKNIYHPIVLASLFHYKFIRIHPFDDGNGRTARLLMNLILMHYGYPLVLISSDPDQRNNYYNVLELTDAKLPLLEQVFEPNNLSDYEIFIQFIGERMVKSFEMIEEIIQK